MNSSNNADKKMLTVDISSDIMQQLDDAVHNDPFIASKSALIRKYIDEGLNPVEPNQRLSRQIADLQPLMDAIAKHDDTMGARILMMNDNLAAIRRELKSMRTNIHVEDEINNYLDSITMQLFQIKIEETMGCYTSSQLIRLLEFPHHGKYIQRWLSEQEGQKMLQITRNNKILWNEEKIRTLYRRMKENE